MAIRVRFGTHGFHHPAFGRLGRGKNADRIYVLPDEFAEKETIKIPTMDNTARPPRKTGEIEVTRYKHLPASAEIISDEDFKEMVEEANLTGEEPPKAARPITATPEALEKVTGRGKTQKRQDAQERTTGVKRGARRPAAK